MLLGLEIRIVGSVSKHSRPGANGGRPALRSDRDIIDQLIIPCYH